MNQENEPLFESNEELHFYWYLKELIKHGFVVRYKYQPKPFTLTNPVHAVQIVRGQRKTRTKSVMILRPHQYQADFLIYWNKTAKHIFYAVIDDILQGTSFRYDNYPFIANKVSPGKNYSDDIEAYSVVDVKGNYSQNDAYRRFSIDQKLVMDKVKIYVQKVIPVPSISKEGKIKTPSAIFYRTFTPERFLLTDKDRKVRKIRFPVKSIKTYITEKLLTKT